MYMFQIYSATIVYFTVCDTCCRPFPSLYTFLFDTVCGNCGVGGGALTLALKTKTLEGPLGIRIHVYRYKNMSLFGVPDSFFVFCYCFTLLFLRYLVWPFGNYSRRSPVPRLSGYQYNLHVVACNIVRALQCVNDTDGNREKCSSSCPRPMNSTRFVLNIDEHGVYNSTVQCERPRCSVTVHPLSPEGGFMCTK